MTEVASRLRVVVADDHPLYLDSLVRMIESHPDVVLAGSASSGRQAFALIAGERPDVAVLDMHMPGLDGRQVLACMRAAGISTGVILISGYADPDALYRALSQGADGLLSKDAGPEAIVSAIKRVADGQAVLSLEAQTALVHSIRSREEAAPPSLTEREHQVLTLAADGLSNKQIGERLYLGTETVKTHLRSTYVKLKASGRAAAVSTAIGRGLLSAR